jgi:hypothetical protein
MWRTSLIFFGRQTDHVAQMELVETTNTHLRGLNRKAPVRTGASILFDIRRRHGLSSGMLL